MDHALTLRLPEPVYQAARNMANRRGISLNRLVQEAIAEKAATSTADRLKEAYDLLAASPPAEVEDWIAVQAEAVLGE